MSNNNDILLKKAQNTMLNIFIEVDRICKKHKLSYWLDLGTLLGAHRHQGFIPWDDDLDIAMPREDYIKFLEIAKTELDSKYFLQNKSTEKSFYTHYTKIRDKKSIFIEKHEKNKKVTYHQGIFIDIFPVNYINRNNTKIHSSLRFIAKIFANRYIDVSFLGKAINKLANNFHNEKNNFIVRGPEVTSFEIKLPKGDIFPLKEVNFENHLCFIPNNVEKYLELFYGKTYMTLPPENKRHTHADSIVFID